MKLRMLLSNTFDVPLIAPVKARHTRHIIFNRFQFSLNQLLKS